MKRKDTWWAPTGLGAASLRQVGGFMLQGNEQEKPRGKRAPVRKSKTADSTELKSRSTGGALTPTAHHGGG